MLKHMNCPYCASSTKVTNSRQRSRGSQVWRRRVCTHCDSIWTTHESVDMSKSHDVVTRQNSVEPFSRDNLFISIKDSLQHRKTALSDATYLTDTILTRILALKTSQVSSQLLTETTIVVLKNFDPLAAKVYGRLHT